MTITLGAQSFMHHINILGMVNDVERARRAFETFLDINKDKLSARKLSALAGLSPSAASQFIKGNSRSPKNETLAKFARGASEALGRTVTIAEMIGEKPTASEIPVRSYVGAGDEVIPIDGDEPLDYVPAPPGLEDGEATEVRGRSMLPLYRDRDLLFHRRMAVDPKMFRGEVVVVQVIGGKRYVKLLEAGTRRGRFHLVSFNPAFAILENQEIDWIGPIEWVRKGPR